MTLAVGIIGMGAMGEIHLRNLNSEPQLAQTVGFYEPNQARATLLANGSDLKSFDSPESLIQDSAIEAVVVSSPADLHFHSVKHALRAGKYVFCEKPLVTTLEHSKELLDMEQASGAQLIWVNFMRRFDNSYLNLKNSFDSGRIGAAIFARMSHRNPNVPESFTNAQYMLETFIHEFDATHWLLGQEIEIVKIVASVSGKFGPNQFEDPQFFQLVTSEGVEILLDGHIRNHYGYQILCELIGESGSIDLSVAGARHGIGNEIQASWAERFQQAYASSIRAWLTDVSENRHTGASASDADRALRVALAAIESAKTGDPQRVIRY